MRKRHTTRTNESLRRAFMLSAIAAALRRGVRAEPKRFAVLAALAIAAAALDVLPLLLLSRAVDALTSKASTSSILLLVTCLGLAYAAGWAVRAVLGRISFVFERRIGVALRTEFAELEMGAPTLSHYDEPEARNRLFALRGKSYALEQWYGSFIASATALIRLTAMFAVISLAHPLTLILVPLAICPTIAGYVRGILIERSELASSESRRAAAALFGDGTSRAYAKDIRMLQLESRVRADHAAASGASYRTIRASRVRMSAVSLAGWAVFCGGIAVFIHFSTASTPGGIVLVGSALMQMSAIVSLLATELPYLQKWTQVSDDLTWFEEYTSSDEAKSDTVPKGVLEFSDVSFTYPRASEPSLVGASFRATPGSTYAVVGINGAGKSTLMNLIGGLYVPQQGTITIDGTPLTDLSAQAYRLHLTGAFQDVYHFPLTVHEYLDVANTSSDESRGSIRQALESAGLTSAIQALPDGINTRLAGINTPGAELSVGQWQRLALARSNIRATPDIIILDEPSSALDAPAERALFQTILNHAHRQREAAITFVISHNSDPTEWADQVIVLDGGRIVEQGTPQQLLEHDGVYAELRALRLEGHP